ncbi:MAG: thermonuclease family protein [candidate division FCPU426 bacterium]
MRLNNFPKAMPGWAAVALLLILGPAMVLAAGNPPQNQEAEVLAVEDANLLRVRIGQAASLVQLAGLQRTGYELAPERCQRESKEHPKVCQLGDTVCAAGLAEDDPCHPRVQSYRNLRAQAFLQGLIEGQKVRLQYLAFQTDSGPRPALVYRSLDGIFVNLAMVRKGYALVAEKPDFEQLESLRQAQTQARGEKAGLWGAPLPVEQPPAP